MQTTGSQASRHFEWIYEVLCTFLFYLYNEKNKLLGCFVFFLRPKPYGLMMLYKNWNPVASISDLKTKSPFYQVWMLKDRVWMGGSRGAVGGCLAGACLNWLCQHLNFLCYVWTKKRRGLFKTELEAHQQSLTGDSLGSLSALLESDWQCTALTYSFSNLEPVCCSMSSSNCCFLTCIQASQEAGQVVWYSPLLMNFPQFVVIHTVKGFDIVNKTEIDVFLELYCFFNGPEDVGNLISGSSAFLKSSLNI